LFLLQVRREHYGATAVDSIRVIGETQDLDGSFRSDSSVDATTAVVVEGFVEAKLPRYTCSAHGDGCEETQCLHHCEQEQKHPPQKGASANTSASAISPSSVGFDDSSAGAIDLSPTNQAMQV
jgi:hypothetical protein